MTSRIDAVMDAAIANETIVGAELAVARHGDIVYRRSAGWYDREAGVPMIDNAIYRLASVTKPIVAATALAMVDKELIALDTPITQYIPWFVPRLKDGREARITVHHLLTHTAGLAYAYPQDPEISTGLGASERSLEENFSRVAQHALEYEPGSAWQYSVAIDVLGAVLAQVHGGTLGDAVKAHITGPLGMSETGFFVADEDRLAKPYADGTPPTPMRDPEAVQGDNGPVTFSPSRIFSKAAFQSGGAGMAGTPADILRFLEAMRTGGGGAVQRDTVALAFSNRIGDVDRDPGQRFGYLGAIVDDPAAANSPSAKGTVNWGGVYGHSWLIDPANGLSLISMSNTALEGCTGRYPKDIIQAVYAELT
ncbi:CubicO group peptidase, beta-lactamase class C family [Devosia lucknowensis]|uniref:CubicO group peptidase, beta-lactamase class C family n=1 Tax=Devosia lucknowensis TaxID=1096929 RepID=A0A1Y6EM43_9HYPH|nr:serine hydrolase domain-containing protein [Devosia lucknowensis]SMQ63728.1 CubicO group peptidase, beta-lactamase class C family [Devosia lucknowensis]